MFAVIIYIFVFISGATGLMYEVLWHKFLNMYMGGHAFSTALILSTFFLFLSLGYLFFGRIINRTGIHPIKIYALLELGIGVFGLIGPMYFSFLYSVWPVYATGSLSDFISSLLFAFIFIGPSCFLMGGTIPSLVEALSSSEEVSSVKHANIYSINTLGAFFGVLVAGFFMIEKFGVEISFYIAGAFNLFIYLGISVLSFVPSCNKYFVLKNQISLNPKNKAKIKWDQKWLFYSIALLAGFYVFSLQNILIRMAGLSLGSSSYSFSLIVAVFILGIAVGAKLSTIFFKHWKKHFLHFQYLFLFCSLFFCYLCIQYWPKIFYFVRLLFSNSIFAFSVYWFFVFLVFLVMLIPVMIFIGTNLPSLFASIENKNDIADEVGSLYFSNSIGSFLGTVFGGYLLLNYFTEDQIFKLNLYLVLIVFLLSLKLQNLVKKYIYIYCLGFFAVFFLPSWKDVDFVPGAYLLAARASAAAEPFQVLQQLEKNYKIVFSKHDPNTIVNVLENNYNKNDIGLYVNGKMDANSVLDTRARAYNALVPMTLMPKAEKVFVIGLGAGLSTAIFSSLDTVSKVDVAEISSGVILAQTYFQKYNKDLKSEKVSIYNNDALKVLREKNELYDIIVSEPSNPWVPGVENLYSVEHLSLAKSKLSKNGIYAQWFPTYDINKNDLLLILNSFKQIFPKVHVWSNKGASLLVLASNENYDFDLDSSRKHFDLLAHHYKAVGIDNFYSMLATQIFSEFTVSSLVYNFDSVQSMLHPKLAYSNFRSFFTKDTIDWKQLLELNMSMYSSLDQKQSNMYFYENLDDIELKKYLNAALSWYQDSIFYFLRDRYNMLQTFESKKQPTDINLQQRIMNYKTLYALDKLSFANTKDFFTNWSKSIDIFFSTQLSFSPQTIVNVFPPQCAQELYCIKSKVKLLSKLKIMPENVKFWTDAMFLKQSEKVDQIWSQVFKAQK